MELENKWTELKVIRPEPSLVKMQIDLTKLALRDFIPGSNLGTIAYIKQENTISDITIWSRRLRDKEVKTLERWGYNNIFEFSTRQELVEKMGDVAEELLKFVRLL